MSLKIESALADARKQWESEKSAHDARNDARFQLAKAGFKNAAFIKGLLSDFDPGKISVQDYVKAVMENKENRAFLDSAQPMRNPDTQPTSTADARKITPETLKQLQNSAKPEDRAQARSILMKQWTSTGVADV